MSNFPFNVDAAARYLATEFGYGFVFKHREGTLTADPGDEHRYSRDYWRNVALKVRDVAGWDDDANGMCDE